jgi:hypothetical protein
MNCVHCIKKPSGREYPCSRLADFVDLYNPLQTYCAKHAVELKRLFSFRLVVDIDREREREEKSEVHLMNLTDRDRDEKLGIDSFSSQKSPAALGCKTPLEPLPGRSTCIDLDDNDSLLVSIPIQNIGELVSKHSIYLPKPKDKWRMLKSGVVGEVNGLPMFRGVARATNGIHVAIETSSGALIIGHFDWFIVDEKDEAISLKEEVREISLQGRLAKQLNEMEELFVL